LRLRSRETSIPRDFDPANEATKIHGFLNPKTPDRRVIGRSISLRRTIGILALVLGVPALWWYAAEYNGRKMEEVVVRGAQVAADRLETRVSGRDIEVSGFVENATERDAVLASLNAVEGRRVVRDMLELLPVASPYVFAADKTADGLTVSGHLPNEAARTALLAKLPSKAADLKLASGAPQGWSDVVSEGLAALDVLEKGRLELSNRTVTLSGTAQTPHERELALKALEDLPEGYTLNASLDSIEKPNPEFRLQYSASGGAALDGELPAGLTKQMIADALQLEKVSGNAEPGTWGTPERTRLALDELADWLPEVESLTFQSLDNGFKLEIEALPGTDLDLLKSEMAQVMGDDVVISISAAEGLPPEGTNRVNAATGDTETMINGNWLPQMDFTADYAQCQEHADALFKNRQVNFVTASARLDAKSIRVINAITSLVRKCVLAGALTVEVGGHTDNQGDAEFNQKLSEDRAQAVVRALVERGVPQAAITAAGYGETRPVATNETEDGRATNRRVALIFSKVPAENAN
jgi:outer membrane protein OmpA-like peptidoglycan-associated protein